MTMKMKLHEDEVLAHKSNISRDEMLYTMAEYCIKQDCTIDRAIADFVQIAIKQDKFKIFLSGSIYTGFYGNSQDYALTKIIKINYGKNANMIIGNIVHTGRDFAIKYKLVNNKFPKLSVCIKEMKKYAKKAYQTIQPDEIDKHTLYEVFLESTRIFKYYYKNLLPFNRSIASEIKMNVELPIEMFKNPNYAKYFAMTGIADSIEKNQDGTFTITDLKTSKKKISGYVEYPKKLKELVDEKNALYTQKKENEKLISKFENAQDKVNEATNVLKESRAALDDAKSKGKATKAIENRIIKYESELEKWQANLMILMKMTQNNKDIDLSIKEIYELINPLQKQFDEEKNQADLNEAKKIHCSQLTHYAICYMFEYGIQPKYARVENLVKHKTIEHQIFEWEITRDDLIAVQEEILVLIGLTELVLDGVDPILLFRKNHTGYIGSDTEKFKDEVQNIIYTMTKSA